jgi:hypothetical protein
MSNKIECNVDADGCTADDGESCPECVAYLKAAEAEAGRAWAVASPYEKNPKKYREDMRDAGRDHLLPDDDP